MILAKNILKKVSLGILSLLLLGGIFGGGFYFGQKNNALLSAFNRPLAYSEDAAVATGETDSNLDFNLYWQVWDTLKSNYVDKNKIDDQSLFYGSLKGLAEATGDPYTIFMDPSEAKEFSDDLAGTFEGIGAEVGIRNEMITVVAPLDGMPAQKAGLRAGDKIYAVDGTPTIGLSLNAVVKKIRGPKDSVVVLTIIRDEEKPREIEITRSVIIVKSVKTELRSDGIFIIKVTNFNDDTEGLFEKAINTALTKNPKGIILDLRNNPGGYLETAVNMASEWVKEGPVVAEQFGGNKRQEYFSNGNARLQNFPTMVLVNGGSASASEILAGALRDYKKGTLIGEITYGKGSVQTLRNLDGGASLKITVAKWLTPAGDFINEKGLEPDIEIKMTSDDIDNDLDPQMKKALELLKAQK
ncbi:hypothetical protein COT93_00955 [Candidatus Falkowbacteria bacterium CG10_big_fil_rev_8_21_14_0_10_37_18]|uniref:PDZ domain-containing protein n=1 Tax=Candidatus Falkowbacteria bacterium CG10_big_fil_rev_8_21_14_0_10_37_18 TaxID=1974562 RepID=A0A2H0V9B4_9BACT|nr:MAG: hypothetical protein COT93_00955 [Candidatus Falkowbacteria bacterium CG10_big_fil_rev_8_21_14_0_10_37_18]